MRFWAFILGVLVAGDASADDWPAFLPTKSLVEQQVLTCATMQKIDEQKLPSCVFASANECGNSTTRGIATCINSVRGIWESLLAKEVYAKLAAAKIWDDETRLISPQLARRGEALQESQSAWFIYRQAECRLSYTEAGLGSMRSISFAACMLSMTALRYFRLRDFPGAK